MCGIVGVLNFRNRAQIDQSVLERMCATIAHRGPDDQGIYKSGPVGLGMRRLSIIDVAGGAQPLSNEDGTVWIVFNGEIYNHSDLRKQLLTRGHRFSTQSDTETIVHLYEEHGRDCLQQLRGMFAFAIWDSRTQSIFLARDRLGIKPLYYYLDHEHCIFGSEIKSLLSHPLVKSSFNHTVLPEYLAFGYVSGTETCYAGIKKLLPGHWLEINASSRVETAPYWDLPAFTDKNELSEDKYVNAYREMLEETVRMHLMSDVPLGVFLSGGLDSSAVAAVMTRIQRAPVMSFSVGYAVTEYSELEYARTVAQHIGANHHEVLVNENDFFDALPKLIWHEDEPITWPSSIALYFVARLAREHVKVVLTGEGSDETLAGYGRYAFTLKNASFDRAFQRLVPPTHRRQIRQFISTSSWLSAEQRRTLSHTFVARDGQSWESFYFENFLCAFAESEQAGLIQSELLNEFDSGQSYRHVLGYWKNAPDDLLKRLLYTDIKTYLVELLMKQDNMSMAASIESRVPFLDHELVQFAVQIPKRLLIKGLSGKEILKRAVTDLLPESIIRRKKMGFPTPWARWLSGQRLHSIERLLLEERSLGRGLFNAEAISKIILEHSSGYRDNSDRIWRLLNLELWHRICIDGEAASSVARDLRCS